MKNYIVLSVRLFITLISMFLLVDKSSAQDPWVKFSGRINTPSGDEALYSGFTDQLTTWDETRDFSLQGGTLEKTIKFTGESSSTGLTGNISDIRRRRINS